jgi:OmpA-OmpF porin, OOP family
MFKQIMTATVLGVSALGMMVANATTPGIYVTGQAGYANAHMKDKIKLPVPGFKIANGGLAGRLGIGYQLNSKLAVELGYLQLAKRTGTVDASTKHTSEGTIASKQNAIDLAAKGIVPITDKFNAYGKLGVAYLTNTITSHSGDITEVNNKTFGIAKHKWAPEAAVGVSYDITPNMFVDTSWTHIQPLGKNRPGNIDFVAVGLGYSFG